MLCKSGNSALLAWPC